MASARTWVICDASPEDEDECSFMHFWTPNGLTRTGGAKQIDSARRCGWKPIAVTARTHREAMEKAKVIFDRIRARRQR